MIYKNAKSATQHGWGVRHSYRFPTLASSLFYPLVFFPHSFLIPCRPLVTG